MGRSQRSFFFWGIILCAVTVPTLSWATCGAPQVCSDVSTSFYGQLNSDEIVLHWSTDKENTDVATYKLRRYNCGTPGTCSTDVTTISRTGTCNTTENYNYTDYPSTPVSQWTYTLEVWKSAGGRQCAVDTVPQ